MYILHTSGPITTEGAMCGQVAWLLRDPLQYVLGRVPYHTVRFTRHSPYCPCFPAGHCGAHAWLVPKITFLVFVCLFLVCVFTLITCAKLHNYRNMAMGDDKVAGRGLIFECFDISLENRPTYCRYMQTLCSSCMRAQVATHKFP